MSFDPRPKPTTPMSLRRANVLAQLDLERQAHDGYRARRDPIDELDRRVENLESLIARMADRLADAENLAAQAMERAEAA